MHDTVFNSLVDQVDPVRFHEVVEHDIIQRRETT